MNIVSIWWDSLSGTLQVFYGIALLSSALLVVQLVLMLLGLDVDGLDDADAGGVLSIRAVVAFFLGFGWAGVAAIRSGLSLFPTLIISTGVGGLFMGGVLLLMRMLYGLRYSGTLDYKNAIGNVGSVYLKIPAGMKSPGQVEVMVQGRLMVVQALTRSGEDLTRDTRIRVVDVVDQNTLLVEPLDYEVRDPRT